MKKQIIITVIITIIIGTSAIYLGNLYADILKFNPLGKLIVIGIILLIMLMIVYNMIQRIKEIREEDDDDFSQY
ncbi:MAG: hypothetical protein WC996_05175 [Peptostreptococcales bacterium]|jgi:hypothetical protein